MANRKLLVALCFASAVLACGCNNNNKCDEEQAEVTEDSVILPETTTVTGKGILQGNTFNKNWNMSVEAGAGFPGLYTDAAGNTYAITSYGALYSCAGNQSWKREPISSGYTRFSAVGGYGDDVYAAGYHSALFHKKGSDSWIRENPGGDSLWFTAIYACKNEVWLAAGGNGSVWHRSGNSGWQRELATGGFPVNALYGNGGDLWALGRQSVYHKKPGIGWVNVLTIDEKVDFHTLYRYGNDVWVMGTGGNIYYNNGSGQWIRENKAGTKDDIYCSYGRMNEVYAAGANGLILHRLPGGQWVKEGSGYQDFSAKCMYGRGQDIWIGGSDGFIFHKNGNGAWTKETGPAKSCRINAISGRGDTLFAAGEYATLLTRTHDNAWTKAGALMPDTPLTSIFKFSKDILVGGQNGTLYHRQEDGQWRLENSHAGDIVFADLYENDKSIYLVGSKGTVACRHKADTAWTSQVTGPANLTRIYGYGNDIWIMGSHSTLLHKKENTGDWQAINTGVSEVDFMDVYGWRDQIWALGVKDGRGIIFHKDSLDKWSQEEIRSGVDHFHALYGRSDTVWAAGASGDWGSKNKSEDNYEGTIICKEGNSPWTKQINHLGGVHFNAINGEGDDIYALGNAGNVYHKHGNSDWEKEETYHAGENLSKLVLYKGLVMLSNNGFLYRENEDKNFIRIDRTGKLINIVALDGELFCADQRAIFKISPAEEKYPVVDKVSYTPKPFINPSSIDLNFVLQRPQKLTSDDMYQMEIYARPYNEEYDESKWVLQHTGPLNIKVNKNTNSFLISTNFEVSKNLRVIPGLESADKICVRVDITTTDGLARESFVLKDSNGNPFITLNNNFWLTNKAWIIPAGILMLYYTFWLLTWFFYPLFFLRMYHSGVLQELMSLPPRYHLLIGMINIVLPLKSLIATARVQNAWVMAFAATADDKYKKSEITQLRSHYVSLPVRMVHPVTGPLVEKPGETMLGQLFGKERTIIQIIGPGGSGKTSLAVAMSGWIIQLTCSRQPGWTPRLPILLETDSSDLLKEITGILRSWQNDYAIHEDFVRMLLKNQRLVVIADSLSERPAGIQDYFKKLHGNMPANALIITARQPIDLQVKEGINLYPSPLNSKNLLHFITTYLALFSDHPLMESREQLVFAEKIVSIVDGKNNKTPVTPILVKLIIEISFKTAGNDKRDFQALLGEMPDSIPDVYYEYLVRVNPTNPTTANFLPKQDMLQIAELLGRLSLGNNFIPQDFPEDAAREVISLTHGDLDGDPIQRFIDNGILTRRESLANSYLRFNLDPLAEYLAASKLYDENNISPQHLAAFTAKVNLPDNEALEFKMAFAQISDYKMKHG